MDFHLDMLLAGNLLNFLVVFLLAGIVLCFVFSMRRMLIMH